MSFFFASQCPLLGIFFTSHDSFTRSKGLFLVFVICGDMEDVGGVGGLGLRYCGLW